LIGLEKKIRFGHQIFTLRFYSLLEHRYIKSNSRRLCNDTRAEIILATAGGVSCSGGGGALIGGQTAPASTAKSHR